MVKSKPEINAFRVELPNIVGTKNSQRLEARIKTISEPNVISRILKDVRLDPEDRKWVCEVSSRIGVRVTMCAVSDRVAGSYQPTPGKIFAPPPSILMVCPVDPDHLQRKVAQSGRKKSCHVHNCDLKPGKLLGCPLNNNHRKYCLKSDTNIYYCSMDNQIMVPLR